jgi:DNA invertase Pin-like site-specific DNA recombinase
MKTPQPGKNKVIAALYLRLSRDEAARQESYSVVNQRRILTEYCEEHGFDIYDEYIDDGYTGVTYNRPGFKRMMVDIEAGKVNCVVVKDLSRMGRNSSRTDIYIEETFPDLGVRLISIGENFDSESGDEFAADILPVVNMYNTNPHKKQAKRL